VATAKQHVENGDSQSWQKVTTNVVQAGSNSPQRSQNC